MEEKKLAAEKRAHEELAKANAAADGGAMCEEITDEEAEKLKKEEEAKKNGETPKEETK